jgi:hypothetical protein
MNQYTLPRALRARTKTKTKKTKKTKKKRFEGHG